MDELILGAVAIIGARLVVPLTDQLRKRSKFINGVPLIGAMGIGLALGMAAWGVAWVSELATRTHFAAYVMAGLSAGGLGGGGRQLSNRVKDSGGLHRVKDRPLE